MRTWLRRGGIALGVLLALGVVAVATVWAIGSSRFNRAYTIAPHELPPPNDSSMERGRYLVATRGCAGCHGANLGGQLFVSDPKFAILPAPNLTRGRGGAASRFSDLDWERAIRHGVGSDGRTFLLMPSQVFADMSDADVRAIVTYISAQPPVDTTYPARRIGPLARVLVGGGVPLPLPARVIEHDAAPSAPREEVSVAYGAHLGLMCQGCHGGRLEGSDRGAPPLDGTSPVAQWTEEQFITTLRTGTTPDGRQLGTDMPWKVFGQMNETELRAIYLYLRSVQGTAARS